MSDNARAFWVTGPGRGEMRNVPIATPKNGEVRVRALFSGVSRGTECLVFAGRVPPSQFTAMRAPFQASDFPAPVKYGYASVGYIEVGVGAHYVPVVLGDIGDEHRLEFAVIGDTVNIASRLENLTRELGVTLIASNELVARVRDEGGGADLFGGLRAQDQAVRGREGLMRVWALARPAPAPA